MNEKMERANKYFKLLHPESELATLSEEEHKRALKDEDFIRENIDKIEIMYSMGIKNGIEPSSAIKRVVNVIKVNKYRDILYSDEMDFVQEENFSEEQQQAYDKRQQELKEKMDFVRDHIDEIDKYYQACVHGENGTRYEGMTEQQILQEAIENLSRKISVQAIGQATINASTTAKKAAEQVENAENTRDNIKEGEEVGDDN